MPLLSVESMILLVSNFLKTGLMVNRKGMCAFQSFVPSPNVLNNLPISYHYSLKKRG